jgi:hypothetical protein
MEIFNNCFKNIINRSMKKSIFNSLIVLIAVGLIVILHACSSDDATTGTPTISGFTPSTGGPVNTYVKIAGTFFSTDASKNTVKFNGTPATLISVTKSEIVTLVPVGATSGKITVTVGTGTASSPSDFAVSNGVPTPVISGFSPTSGNGIDADSVTISGYNFSTTPANNTVKFNGKLAPTPKVLSSTSLKVAVPLDASAGKITVAVLGAAEAATSDADFTIPAPTIVSFTPTFSTIGSTVVITGTNFSKTASNNLVEFNGVAAETPSSASGTSLTVIVPEGATTGNISVTINGQTATGGEFNLPHTFSSFSPLLGTVGDTILITGTNFSASAAKNVVKFKDKEAKVKAVSNTTLKAVVPEGAATGKISVTINGNTQSSLTDFIVN